MSKESKIIKLSKIDLIITELQTNVVNREFRGDDLITARSLLSYYVAGVDLSFKQAVLVRVLNAKCNVVKPKELKARKHSLYAVSDGTSIKLGISTNIGKRIRSMQTSSATELKLIWRYYVGKDKKIAFQYERKLHRLCKAHRLKGEWFNSECMELVEKFKR